MWFAKASSTGYTINGQAYVELNPDKEAAYNKGGFCFQAPKGYPDCNAPYGGYENEMATIAGKLLTGDPKFWRTLKDDEVLKAKTHMVLQQLVDWGISVKIITQIQNGETNPYDYPGLPTKEDMLKEPGWMPS